MKKFLLASTMLCLMASNSNAADQAAKAPRSRILIMLETKFVAGQTLKGHPDKYAHDNNVNTIELVALPKGDMSPSMVSADGQVIFLSEKDLRSGSAREDLAEQAFDIIEKKEKESVTN
jgi:hypothetical protein